VCALGALSHHCQSVASKTKMRNILYKVQDNRCDLSIPNPMRSYTEERDHVGRGPAINAKMDSTCVRLTTCEAATKDMHATERTCKIFATLILLILNISCTSRDIMIADGIVTLVFRMCSSSWNSGSSTRAKGR
jgi:hypothetical protein